MKYLQLIIICFLLNIIPAQSQSFRIEGTHTLIQSDGMDLYEAINQCLGKALVNGVYEYLLISNEYNEEQMNKIMPILDGAIQMCVKEPVIIKQEIKENNITIIAEGIINPFILNQILGENN